MSKTNVNELVLAYRAGDVAATDRLMRWGMAWIRRYIIRRRLWLPGWDMADLVSEGLVALIEALQIYDPSRDPCFDRFASRLVRWHLWDVMNRVLRRTQGHETISLDVPAYRDKHNDPEGRERHETWNLPDQSGLGADPVEFVTSGFEAGQLRDLLLEGLSERERRAVLICWVGGYNYRSAAAIIGCHPQHVDHALQRARRKLRKRALALSQDSRLSEETRAVLCRVSRQTGRRPRSVLIGAGNLHRLDGARIAGTA
jgi:RNA polymerase sigma factor (sigma-70 family)